MVTTHPTATWTARQLVEACGVAITLKYLIRDRDGIYGNRFQSQAAALGIEEVITAVGSPWQNAYAERVIGSIRRACLDHVIVLGERHLKRILSSYVHYYHSARTHLSLDKDAPDGRAIQSPDQDTIVELPRVGGLHHEYVRMAAGEKINKWEGQPVTFAPTLGVQEILRLATYQNVVIGPQQPATFSWSIGNQSGLTHHVNHHHAPPGLSLDSVEPDLLEHPPGKIKRQTSTV